MTASAGWAAIAVAALSVAVAVVVLARRDAGNETETARWRARAIEAEAEIAALRQRLRALEAERSAPAVPPDAIAKGPPPPLRTDAPAADPRVPERSEEPPDEAWSALVEGALQEQARERLGRELEPEQLDRLLGRLRELREAAVALEHSDGATRDAVSTRLQRSLLVVQADQALREELGVGMSGLLRDLDEGRIEDLSLPTEDAPDVDAEEAPVAELP